ncbi:DUF4387 domain-containing protein [Enterocloster lavalensis]|uniref:DUF4387 domain-containing protein n=1 Tax=Enterocloster lavalensis TaxID=460384 RepID=UPI0023EFEE98|nr:DUF4387 domain-containing protein [Enterocloster lavalensis]
MKKLYELAKLIRSKNAGPFMESIDILFADRETYDKVLATGALSTAAVAELYKVDESSVSQHNLPLANAVKFSFPRRHPSGDFLDDDLYGCQQHRPMVNLEIPLD